MNCLWLMKHIANIMQIIKPNKNTEHSDMVTQCSSESTDFFSYGDVACKLPIHNFKYPLENSNPTIVRIGIASTSTSPV